MRSPTPRGRTGSPGTSPSAARAGRRHERGQGIVIRILAAVAAGFTGSTAHRQIGDEHALRVRANLTYAGRRENLPPATDLVVGAIEDPKVAREAMEGCDAVVTFAAESHVDRSIDDQDAFARTHVVGTGTLLDAARELGVGRYLQVSTDEVYGSLRDGPRMHSSPVQTPNAAFCVQTPKPLLP